MKKFWFLLLAAGCGSDSILGSSGGLGGLDGGSMDGGGFGSSGFGSNTPPPERTTINVRFVHTYSPGDGVPGIGVDIYRKWPLGTEAAPIITNLKYGEVSPFVHPLADNDAFAFYNTGTKERAEPYSGFVKGGKYVDGSRETMQILSGSKSGGKTFRAAWNSRIEAPTKSGAFPPEANPAKARVMLNDIGLEEYPGPGYYVGAKGACVSAIGTSSPKLLVTDTRAFEFEPGAISIGLHLNGGAAPNCGGTPAIGPATLTGAAGSRTWVYFYGPSASDLRTLVLPFGE
jgi:hypothetical protein